MNIYHYTTSHTLLKCKSHANHNEEAGKHAGYNNELYDMVNSSPYDHLSLENYRIEHIVSHLNIINLY